MTQSMNSVFCVRPALVLVALLVASAPAQADFPVDYRWMPSQSGFGYCYAVRTDTGAVLNGNSPMSPGFCEQRDPSKYVWSTAIGHGPDEKFCFQVTSSGLLLNGGSSVDSSLCANPPARPAPAAFDSSKDPSCRYFGKGGGSAAPVRFREVTQGSGLESAPSDHVSWGDFDGDGKLDLLIGKKLYRNVSGTSQPRFLDVTAEAGLSGMTGAGIFVDIDSDGRVDILTNTGQIWYQKTPGKFSLNGPQLTGILSPKTNVVSVVQRHDSKAFDIIALMNEEEDFSSHPPQYFRLNPGTNQFEDVSLSLGFQNYPGYGRGISIVDYRNDNRPGIYFTNYRLKQNYLFDVDGDALHEVGEANGVWGEYDPKRYYDYAHQAYYGPNYGHTIGSTWVDLNNDGYWDLWASKLAHKYLSKDDIRGYVCDDSKIYRNTGAPDFRFVDMRDESGIPRKPVGGDDIYQGDELWSGAAAADFDNDGLVDLFVPQIYALDYSYSFLFHNDCGFRFSDKGQEAGIRVFDVYFTAWADFDNDGKMDLLVIGRDTPKSEPRLHLYRNVMDLQGRNFLKVRLTGTVSNRGAIGAVVKVYLKSGGLVMRQEEAGSGAYVQQNDPTLHFGLGSSAIDHVEVRWPSGKVQMIRDVKPNTTLSVTER